MYNLHIKIGVNKKRDELIDTNTLLKEIIKRLSEKYLYEKVLFLYNLVRSKKKCMRV